MNKIWNWTTGILKRQKMGKRGIAMGKLAPAGMILMCLGMASPAFADFGSDMTLKLGGSGLYNNSLLTRQAIVGQRQGGGHISIDYMIPGKGFGFSPFLNVYHRVQVDASSARPRNDRATNMIGGLNLLLSGFSSERTNLYVGIGGGAARMKVVSAVNSPVPTTSYSTKLMGDALVGATVKMTQTLSLFVEPQYVWADEMLNGLSVHAGLAFNFNKIKPTPQPRPLPVYISKEPLVVPSAPEPVKVVEVVEEVRVSSAEALATMQEMIYFKNNRSDLSDSAKVILGNKVAVFRANPAMRIVIVGFTSQSGTQAYNMALGLKRAEAARGYLVSQGIDPIRIEIATLGEGQLAVEGPGAAAAAANRRDQFRLLIADPFLAEPKH